MSKAENILHKISDEFGEKVKKRIFLDGKK
jgi:hypothetical protein